MSVLPVSDAGPHAHMHTYLCALLTHMALHMLTQLLPGAVCYRLLWVWLEPLGDLSVQAMQAGNPSKFALHCRGPRYGTPEFLAMHSTSPS